MSALSKEVHPAKCRRPPEIATPDFLDDSVRGVRPKYKCLSYRCFASRRLLIPL